MQLSANRLLWCCHSVVTPRSAIHVTAGSPGLDGFGVAKVCPAGVKSFNSFLQQMCHNLEKRGTDAYQHIYIRVDGTCVLSLFRDNFGPCYSAGAAESGLLFTYTRL